jgi:uncharacterized membrane protein YcfT
LAEGVRAGLTKAQGRKFGLSVGIAFLALTGLLLWRGRETIAYVTGTLSVLLMVGGVVVPTKLGPIERAWMAMAHRISKVTTPLIMGIVYFLVVTPIGLLMRLLGRNPLAHPRRETSFWVDRAEDKVKTGGMRHQY